MILFFLISIVLPIATEGLFWTKQYPFHPLNVRLYLTEDFIDTLTSSKDRWFSPDGWGNVSFLVVCRTYMCNANHSRIISKTYNSLVFSLYPLPQPTAGLPVCKWLE